MRWLQVFEQAPVRHRLDEQRQPEAAPAVAVTAGARNAVHKARRQLGGALHGSIPSPLSPIRYCLGYHTLHADR